MASYGIYVYRKYKYTVVLYTRIYVLLTVLPPLQSCSAPLKTEDKI